MAKSIGFSVGAALLLAAAVDAQGLTGVIKGFEKISETAGGFGGTLEDGDVFGGAVASLGDLDGDGVTDVAIGAPRTSASQLQRQGAVWIVFLRVDGTVKASVRIEAPLDPGDAPGGSFGSALTALGDLDGNGVTDLAVGAPGKNLGSGSSTGVLWILFLNADGTLAGAQRISDGLGGFGGTLASGDRFGAALAALGDRDGDGHLDVAVGAPGDSGLPTNDAAKGSVWLLSLERDGTVLSERRLTAGVPGFPGPLANNDFFGSSVVDLGDLDGNGVSDLGVGAAGDDDGGSKKGAFWLLYLLADGSIDHVAKISATAGGFQGTLLEGAAFGEGAAPLGDLNDDGAVDVAVGAPGQATGDERPGTVWMLFLQRDGSVLQALEVGDGIGGFSSNLDPGDRFGSALAALGDFDGDGVLDLAAGCPGDDDGGADRGSLWLPFITPATEVVNFGRGINPFALFPGTRLPRVGEIWDPLVDFGEGGGGIPLFHFMGISSSRGTIESVAGSTELLISLLPQDLIVLVTFPPDPVRVQVGIPNDLILAGAEVYVQAGKYSRVPGVGGVITFTNGLDVEVGF